MENDILELLKIMNSKLDEHTQILDALKHASEIPKAEIDKVNDLIARVESEIKEIREDLSAVELITSKNWNDIVKLKAVK